MCAGLSRSTSGEKETWRWNTEVDSAVKQKWKCWKAWMYGGSWEEYQNAKCLANMLSYWQNPGLNKEPLRTLHPAALTFPAWRTKNLDVQGEKPVHNDTGELCLDDRAKQAAWKWQYEGISNVEFDWDPDSFTEVYTVEAPALHIPLELLIKAIKLMKCGKDAGTSLIVNEKLKAPGVERAH